MPENIIYDDVVDAFIRYAQARIQAQLSFEAHIVKHGYQCSIINCDSYYRTNWRKHNDEAWDIMNKFASQFPEEREDAS